MVLPDMRKKHEHTYYVEKDKKRFYVGFTVQKTGDEYCLQTSFKEIK